MHIWHLFRTFASTETDKPLEPRSQGYSCNRVMKYNITLEHEDFILLLDTLKKAQESGVIAWSATNMVCQNTKVEY